MSEFISIKDNVCKKCNKILPKTMFNKNSETNKLNNKCKNCVKKVKEEELEYLVYDLNSRYCQIGKQSATGFFTKTSSIPATASCCCGTILNRRFNGSLYEVHIPICDDKIKSKTFAIDNYDKYYNMKIDAKKWSKNFSKEKYD